ncbi:MAG: hypothetical protein OXU81_15515 [Gammaproteobacteria bacterium]|nr:hypothetical protein [Gammaproteobacteria bacterium]
MKKTLVHKRQRGLAELAGVLLLALLAGGWVALEAQRQAQATQYARGRTAGAVFASWMLAAHRRTQEEAAFYEAQLAGALGVPMTQAQLETEGLAPAWLARGTMLDQTIGLGVVDDGAGVPMAFAVAAPARALSATELEGFRAGAAAGGVIGVEALGTELGAETFSGNRRLGAEQALGRTLAVGDLVAVADLGIAYDERVVYRRSQPGRAYLSEMRTDLAFAAGAGVVGAGTVFSETWESSQAFLVGQDASVGADLLAAEAGGQADVESSLVQGDAGLSVTGLLTAETWAVDGTVNADRSRVAGALRAADVTATASLDAGPVLAVDGDVVASGRFRGQRLAGSTLRGRGGGPATRVRGTRRVRGAHTVGNALRVQGRLRVGRCYGCTL